jgi:oligosaccharide repeat unit polymerase
MDNRISLFYGAIRFDLIGLLLCLSFAAIIFWDWYLSYKRTGWKIDFWQFQILMGFFVPVLLMYPVTGSELQSRAVGLAWPDVQQKIDLALGISLFGYASMLAGRILFDRLGPSISSALVLQIYRPLETETRRNIKSGAVTILLIVLVSITSACVLYIAPEAIHLRVRAYFLENDSFRSLYNLLVAVYPLLIFFYWLKNSERMSLRKQSALLLLIVGSVFLGARGPLVSVVLQIFVFTAFRKRGQLSFTGAMLLFVVLAIVGIVINALRTDKSITGEVFTFWANIFYGNNFSDLRDFAWVLSSWDGTWFFGKTYLAALMSFIPRALSEFREEWALGVVTAKLAGFTPQEHAGVRPGMFGESYLNFGLLGVFVIASVNGFFLRYADYQIKRRIELNHGVISAYVSTIPYQISSAFFLTSGFWALYVFVAVQLLASILRRSVRAHAKHTVDIRVAKTRV